MLFYPNKYVNKITVQTKTETKTYDYKDKQFAKFEINSKQVEGATVIIEYKIVATNNGELAGKVGRIIDTLPEGLEFHSELNTDWYSSTEGLVTTALANDTLEVGQSKEINLVLTKKVTSSNVGLVTNNAKIAMSSNEKGQSDINSANDTSKAEVLIGISTGLGKWIGVLMGIVLILIASFVLIIKKKNRKALNIMTFVFVMGLVMFIKTPNSFGATIQYNASTKTIDITENGSTTKIRYIRGIDTNHYGVNAVGITSDGKETSYLFNCTMPGANFCDNALHEITGVKNASSSSSIAGVNTQYKGNPYKMDISKTAYDRTRVTFTKLNDGSTGIGPFRVDDSNTNRPEGIWYDTPIVNVNAVSTDNYHNYILNAESENYVEQLNNVQLGYGISNGQFLEFGDSHSYNIGDEFWIKIPSNYIYVSKLYFTVHAHYYIQESSNTTTTIDVYTKATGSGHPRRCYGQTQSMGLLTIGAEQTEGNREYVDVYDNIDLIGGWQANGNIELIKVDEDNITTSNKRVPLAGVEFVFLLGNNGALSTYFRATTNGQLITNITSENPLVIKEKSWTISDNYHSDSPGNSKYWEYTAMKDTNIKFTDGTSTVRKVQGYGYNYTVPNYPLRVVVNGGTYTVGNTTYRINGEMSFDLSFTGTDSNNTKLSTNSQGKITINNLVCAEYTFFETSCGANWKYRKFVTSVGCSTKKVENGKITWGSIKMQAAQTIEWIIANQSQTANIKIYKRDLDQNKGLENVEFVLKASLQNAYFSFQGANVNNYLYNGHVVNEIASKPYVLVKVAETRGVTNYQNGYAKTVKGKATITGFTFVDSIDKATKFVADSSGNIEIYNLLTATTGREGDYAVEGFEYIDQAEFQYQLIEVSSNNYGYAPRVPVKANGSIKYGSTNNTINITQKRSSNGSTCNSQGIIKLNRQKLTDNSTCLEIEVTDKKLTGNLKIYKRDYDNANNALKNVEFVLKAHYIGNGNSDQYMQSKIDGKYVKIIADSGSNVITGDNGYATYATGKVRVKDKTYTPGTIEGVNENQALEPEAFTSDMSKATKFVTDSNGIIEIVNLLTSTNGSDQIQYEILENESNNYGYAPAIRTDNKVGKSYVVDYSFSSSNGSQYSKNNGNSTQSASALIKLQRQSSVETDNSTIKSTLTVTNKKLTTNFKLYKRDYDQDKKMENVKFVIKAEYDGNGYEDTNQKAKIDGKYIRIMIDSGSNAVIGADGYAKTITGMARVKDQIYSANENSANIKESIAYTSDINKATVFITDADGIIGLQNLLMSTNGNDRIKYDIYEISINRYGYAPSIREDGKVGKNYAVDYEFSTSNNSKYELNEGTATDSAHAVLTLNRLTSTQTNKNSTTMAGNLTVLDKKLTANLKIYKRDYDQDRGLENALFVIRAHYVANGKGDNYFKQKIDGKYIQIMTEDSDNKYLTEVEGIVRVKDKTYDENENPKVEPIGFTSSFADATKFRTDANGITGVLNLLMSTNGGDYIEYEVIELEANNYGYAPAVRTDDKYGNTYAVVFEGETSNQSSVRTIGGTITKSNAAMITLKRQTSVETDKSGNDAKPAFTLLAKNMKLTTNMEIYKRDYDQNRKIENVEFYIKTQYEGNGYEDPIQKARIDGKYLKVMVESAGNVEVGKDGYATKITGKARVIDKVYKTAEDRAVEPIAFTDNKEEATLFVTDSNGQIGISNLQISTNGKDRIKYAFEEMATNNYGYVSDTDKWQNYKVRFEGQTEDSEPSLYWYTWNRASSKLTDKKPSNAQYTSIATVKNIKQTGNLYIRKVDTDKNKDGKTEEVLPNVSFIIKAKLLDENGNVVTDEGITDKYIRIIPDRNQTDKILEMDGEYAKKVQGSVRIKDIVYRSENDAKALDFVDREKATVFVTDSKGIIQISNLLISTNGANKIEID